MSQLRSRYCRSCAYPLYGNESGSCPECGRGFDPFRLATTDPWPGFSRKRLITVSALALVGVLVLGVLLADRFVLRAVGTRWERCTSTGAIRSVQESPIFGMRRSIEYHFVPLGFRHADARWTRGISGVISADPAPPGTMLVLERAGAFGVFRFEGFGFTTEGHLRVLGSYAWREDRGSLAEGDERVHRGTIAQEEGVRRNILLGPFRFSWSEHSTEGIYFYYERFFGNALPGETRMAILSPDDGWRFEQIRYEDVSSLLRATPTDGLPEEPSEPEQAVNGNPNRDGGR